MFDDGSTDTNLLSSGDAKMQNSVLYLLNATSLAKNNAVSLLHAEMLAHQTDCVVITETWFNKFHSNNDVSLPGYGVFRRDRGKRKGGGICAYVKSCFHCTVLDLPVLDAAIEILWFTYESNNLMYIVACCYHPPKPVYDCKLFTEQLSMQVEHVISHYDSCVLTICGDFNSLYTGFLEIEFGLVQLVDIPTHGNNLLDKVFVNRPDIFSATVCKSLLKTKHMSVIVSANSDSDLCTNCKYNSSRRTLSFLDKRDHNIDKLRYLIGSFDWSSLFACTNDIQWLYDNFLAILSTKIEEAIPVITVKQGPRDPPYITPLVKHLLNKRNSLRRKGRLQEADSLATRINAIITDIRSSGLKNLERATTRQLWSSIKKTNNTLPASGPKFNPNCVNEHFARIATSEFQPVCLPDSTQREPFNFYEDYSIAAGLDEISLERRLRNIRPTAPGLDGVPYWVFKSCSYELSAIIAHICHVSIATGEIPSQWRKAVVTPVPKVPNPLAITDYRPISVTPILSRLIERIVVEHYLRPALPPEAVEDQFAFRPTGSTTCALIVFTHYVTSMLENNKFVRCLLIDYSKAFDTIEHCVLLEKLQKLNLPAYVFSWIKSFLLNRCQVVKIGENVSHECNISRGIVQGSVMGPALYAIMASDMRLISKINALCKYADDTTVLSPENTDISLAEEFEHILKWSKNNGLVINKAKTKEIVFHRPDPRCTLPTLKPLENIEVVQCVKMLGVFIADNLKFSTHVEDVLAKCSQKLYLLKVLRSQGLCPSSLRLVFNALVVSRISYALPAWSGFLTDGQIRLINAFFKRAYKYNLCDVVYTFADLQSKIENKFFSQIQIESHCCNFLLPKSSRQDTYFLRAQGHNFVLPSIKYNLSKKSFVSRCLYKFIK